MIREFKNTDLSEVMDIWLNANSDAHKFVPYSYWKDNYEIVKAMIPRAEVLVYEENGKICGFIGMTGEFVSGLFVDKSKRSKGIGTKLLNEVKSKNSALTLSVFEKNKLAINFYERSGFKIKDCQTDEKTREKEYIMCWER